MKKLITLALLLLGFCGPTWAQTKINNNQLPNPISTPNINNIIFVDGVTYPRTQAGVQAALNAAIANGYGYVFVSPGLPIALTSCTTDSESTYALLIGQANHLRVWMYGTTFTPTYSTSNCEALTIRDSQYVTVEGYTASEAVSANPYTGTAISIRRPSNSDPGYAAQNDEITNSLITDFNIGIEMGGAADGQVGQNKITFSQVSNCATADFQQLGAATATNVFDTDTAIVSTKNGVILFDLGGYSATLTAPVTGDGSATGTIHLQFESGFTTATIRDPHIELEQNGGSDSGGRAINWLAAGLNLEVEGGTIQDFRTSGTSTLFQMNNATTGGNVIFRNTQVDRSGGTATLAVSGPGICAESGQWANTSSYPPGPCVRSASNGSILSGFYMPSASAARIWTMPDTGGQVPVTINLLLSATSPTISSGFGTSPSIVQQNGTAAFEVNVGTGGTAMSGVIGLPAAAHGWSCTAVDMTTPTKVTTETSFTTTTVTFFAPSGASWSASDLLLVNCGAF